MNYEILVTDNPIDYKEGIIRLWTDYLPDTPNNRYEWLINGNPAGRAWWFLAIECESKELLGIVTIMPRHFLLRGEKILIGIMGDFVVDPKCRGLGPGLILPKFVVKKAEELGFRLIYTIPYYGTAKHMERKGLFGNRVRLEWLVKPLDFRKYLKKPFEAGIFNTSMRILDAILHLSLSQWLLLSRCKFEEAVNFSDDFDTFWAKLKSIKKGPTGFRDHAYLTWRYQRNPLISFKILYLRNTMSNALIGYVIYTIGGGQLDIYDIQYLHWKSKHFLIHKLTLIARIEHCKGIYLLTSLPNRLSYMKWQGFVSRDEKHCLYYVAFDKRLNFDALQFFQGDRNV
jgi:hypothetical protein